MLGSFTFLSPVYPYSTDASGPLVGEGSLSISGAKMGVEAPFFEEGENDIEMDNCLPALSSENLGTALAELGKNDLETDDEARFETLRSALLVLQDFYHDYDNRQDKDSFVKDLTNRIALENQEYAYLISVNLDWLELTQALVLNKKVNIYAKDPYNRNALTYIKELEKSGTSPINTKQFILYLHHHVEQAKKEKAYFKAAEALIKLRSGHPRSLSPTDKENYDGKDVNMG